MSAVPATPCRVIGEIPMAAWTVFKGYPTRHCHVLILLEFHYIKVADFDQFMWSDFFPLVFPVLRLFTQQMTPDHVGSETKRLVV